MRPFGKPQATEETRGIQTFQTKSPDLLIRESERAERKMKRSLTALDLTMLGIGAIIGTGIFALTGTAAAGNDSKLSLRSGRPRS